MRNNYIVFISSIVYALLVLIGCGDDNPVNDSREEESHDVETILIPLGVKGILKKESVLPQIMRRKL